MSDAYPSRVAEKVVTRLPDGMRDRLAELSKRNGRSVNAEIVLALESWLDLAEHAQQSAHEVANDLPVPERILGTWYLHSDDGGRITKRTLISEWEEIEAERGIHAGDVRIISCSPKDEANDPVKARMAADVRRSREIAEARAKAAEEGAP